MALKDMTGAKIGRLTVIRRGENLPGTHRARWICQCDCGKQVLMRGDVLRQGAQSCGCQNAALVHGECRGEKPSRLYNIWRDMKSRCQNPKNIGYHLYGGRGIRVCEEWQSFEPFYEWAKRAGYEDSLTLDREDTNGDYGPTNCRWATPHEQQTNKRNTVFITAAGRTQALVDWADELGVPRTGLYSRRRIAGRVESYIESLLTAKDGELVEV